MSTFLTNITNMIQELPGLLDAVGLTIPPVIRIVLMIGVALLVLGIFAEVVKLISGLDFTFKTISEGKRK